MLTMQASQLAFAFCLPFSLFSWKPCGQEQHRINTCREQFDFCLGRRASIVAIWLISYATTRLIVQYVFWWLLLEIQGDCWCGRTPSCFGFFSQSHKLLGPCFGYLCITYCHCKLIPQSLGLLISLPLLDSLLQNHPGPSQSLLPAPIPSITHQGIPHVLLNK